MPARAHTKVKNERNVTMKRILSLILCIVLLSLSFTSCTDFMMSATTAGTTEPTTTEPTTTAPTTTAPATYTVTVTKGTQYSIIGEASKTVESGGTVTFRVMPRGDYVLEFSAGEYNEDTGTLTVENVTVNTTVNVTAKLSSEAYYTVSVIGDGFTVDGDSTVSVARNESASFKIKPEAGKSVAWFSAGSFDAATSTLTLSYVRKDTEITVSVGSGEMHKVTVVDGAPSILGRNEVADNGRLALSVDSSKGSFLCWTVGKNLFSGGEVLSNEKGYLLPVTGDMTVYANYSTETASGGAYFIYYMNGGTSPSGNDYYLEELDVSFYTSPNARYDDGGFTRSGCALLEYNTKADGSGVSYSLGSKIKLDGVVTPLYCIWAKETASSRFTTTGTAELTITGYSGTDATVVIPEKIGGVPVTGIAAGAFVSETFTALFMTRNLKSVAAGAFVGCSRLETLYFSDSIVTIPDEAFDEATYSNFTHFYMNATTAPRYAKSYDGGYRVKWDRLMKGADGDMIVFISGSSSLHGVATKYMEALFDGQYTVVNYGTVRTTNNLVYMEAVANFVDEGDIVIYAPENSIYQFGESDLTYKTYRDLEGSLNVWRYVDMRHYDKIFSAFSDYQNRRFRNPEGNYNMTNASIDSLGDEIRGGRDSYANESKFTHKDTHRGDFWITFDERVKPTNENLSAPDDTLWISFAEHAEYVKSVVDRIEATGAKCYFGFGSVNACALTEEAKSETQQAAFAELIADTFDIEVLGTPGNHVFDWKYMLPDGGSDFHLNDYGRPINTYRFYVEICEKLHITPKGMKDLGTSFPGCIFE